MALKSGGTLKSKDGVVVNTSFPKSVGSVVRGLASAVGFVAQSLFTGCLNQYRRRTVIGCNRAMD